MKDSLSSLDLHFLARELAPLVGAHLQKAYQGTGEKKRDLLLQLHQKERKSLVRVLLPGLAYVAEEKPEYEQMPGGFATFLRKHLGNARLVGIEQRGFERILHLKFENKHGVFTLVLELLAPGNALLLNPDGKIINLLEPQKTSSRVLRGGAMYEPPPALFDTKAATADAIAERLFATTKDSIVKALAIDLGLGGDYAEEACARAGVEKGRKDLSGDELGRLSLMIKTLFDESPAPATTDNEAFPITMKTKAATVAQPSFSKAIEAIVPAEPHARKETAPKTKKSKAEDVVRAQEAALAGLVKAADEHQRKGELIYTHYQRIEKLLKDVREAHKTMPWADVKKKFPGVTIDEENGEIAVELEET